MNQYNELTNFFNSNLKKFVNFSKIV